MRERDSAAKIACRIVLSAMVAVLTTVNIPWHSLAKEGLQGAGSEGPDNTSSLVIMQDNQANDNAGLHVVAGDEGVHDDGRGNDVQGDGCRLSGVSGAITLDTGPMKASTGGSIGGIGLGTTVYYGRYFQIPVVGSPLKSRLSEYATKRDDGLWEMDDDLYAKKGSTYYRMAPVAWRVIADEGDTLLLLSDSVLDSRAYSGGLWDACDLRAWLNDFFINTAFTEEERAYIPISNNSFLYRTYDDWRTGTQSQYAISSEQVFLLDRSDIQAGLLDSTGVSPIARVFLR